jgi:hypothetical protein
MQRITRKQAIGTALHRIRLRFFPPVSRRKAVDIAIENGIPASHSNPVFGRMPESVHIYTPTKEPCWFIYPPWNDGRLMLRSSRIVLVSKESGRVLYDGEAGDEG